MLLARWGSLAVLRYLAEAPLASLTNNYKREVARTRAEVAASSPIAPSDVETLVKDHFAQAASCLADVQSSLEILADRVSNLDVKLAAADVATNPPYVRNNRTLKFHRVGSTAATDPRLWTTSCNIFFVAAAANTYCRIEALPVDVTPAAKCFRCFG